MKTAFAWMASGPPGDGAADPTADMFTDLGTRLDLEWFVLALLVPAAIIVLWYGNRQFRRWRGGSQLEPHGRPFAEWTARGDAEWERTRSALEQGPPTPIAEAQAGFVRVEGEIVGSSGGLGGRPGRACVWHNRAGGRPESAVAAELAVIADQSGRSGLENLERARVVAPGEQHSMHYESAGLYEGDRIEVIARFFPERIGEDDDPSRIVYGTLGTHGPIHIRVLERPRPSTTDEDKASASDGTP